MKKPKDIEKSIQLKQKKFGTTITYNLKNQYFDYSIKDPSGLRTFKVDYENISTDIQTLEEKTAWLRNIGLIWFIIGLIQTALIIVAHQYTRFPLWLFVGLGCLIAYYFYTIKYSIISAGEINLLIIKDKNHDAIMSQIYSEKKRYLRNTYFKINKNNNKETELNKFGWLKENNIISLDEYQKIISKI